MPNTIQNVQRLNVKNSLSLFLLLAISCNPLFAKYYFSIIVLLISLWLSYNDNVKQIFTLWIFSAIGFLFLFTSHFFVFDFVSILGVLSFLVKILVGGLIVAQCKLDFEMIFFKLVSKLSILSLPLYVTDVLTSGEFHKLMGIIVDGRISWVFHTYLPIEYYRNCGMFWEPGAFAGVITLSLVLVYHRMGEIYLKFKWQLLAVVIALATTLSTTGYITLFFIGAYALLMQIKSGRIRILYIVVSILSLVIFTIIFSRIEFLYDKINTQFNAAINEQSVGQYSNTRSGSIKFDLYYIEKHPFIGNGIHQITRYADHPQLWDEQIGHGNGFSNFVASFGIPAILIYFTAIYFMGIRAMLPSSLLVMVVFLNLQGEQWLNTPLYLGLPFAHVLKD